MLIGNKTDLNEQRSVSFQDGFNLAEEWKRTGTMASFIETSAKTGEVKKNKFNIF